MIDEIGKIADQIKTTKLDRYDTLKSVIFKVGLQLANEVTTDRNVESNIKALSELKFLPGFDEDGDRELFKPSEDFAIIDNERYGDMLRTSWPLLDFAAGESESLFTFFRRLGIEHRYLSKCVKEESRVGHGAGEDAVLTAIFRKKAYALFW